MAYQFSFSTYSFAFQQPLLTHHGRWTHRSGIWIKLVDTEQPDRHAQGEIAPLPLFGSETLEQAIAFCTVLPPILSSEAIFSIPETHPACQFGFETAWELLQPNQPSQRPNTALTYCALLPTGDSAFEAWETLWQQGYRTFKWKIGVDSGQVERDRVQLLLTLLPPDCQLRLDANGGLTLKEAQNWLNFCDRHFQSHPQNNHAGIEFLEQPLDPSQFQLMQQLSEDYATPLGLDESVASLSQLRQCYEAGWTDVYVIKPAIAGSPQALRTFCRQNPLDLVFSTVFETAIGRQASLNLAQELCYSQRALGYGVNHWLPDSLPTAEV